MKANHGPYFLSRNARKLRTKVGAAFPGTRAVFRGCDLHRELHDINWIDLFVFGITGRRYGANEIEMLNAIWSYTSYPDARLWNNRVAGLAGSVRSTPALGISAAMSVSEASVYGGLAGVRAIDFFIRTQTAIENGANLFDLVHEELRQRYILGYGRPIDSTDERIRWLHPLARKLGLHEGKYLRLAFDVEKILTDYKPHLKMNNAAFTAAICADLGFSVVEFHTFRVPLFLAGMPPCYLESAERVEGSLFPLSIDDIDYCGVASRVW